MENAVAWGFLLSTLALAAPLLLASLGEIIGERAGVLNISLEAMMLCGAWAAAAASFGAQNALVGIGAAVGAGVLVAGLFATLVLTLKSDAVVIGTGLNLLALGLTGTLHRAISARFGSYNSVSVPEWCFALFGLILVPLVTFFLVRTRGGLALRACGEAPQAATSMGVGVWKFRWAATLCNGALCGLAGAFLTLAGVNSFGENVTAGRGFIALAIVIFGRYQPLGALGAALLIAAADAGQIALQGQLPSTYYPLLLALPYVLTLASLAGFAGKSKAPAALGGNL
ncbi:MAG TPA: ABC transporter permease [Abditibacterium sp.]|jgi:simple sugar transport system permease protein